MQEQSKVTSLNKEEHQQAQVISLFALVGLSITAIMGLVGLFNKDFVLASALLLASILYLIGYFSYKKNNNVALSAIIVLSNLYILMFYLVFTGGVDNTGPLWIYIVAPVSLFIHGLKRGLIDIAIFVATISVIMFVPTDFTVHASYKTEFKLRLLYSFFTVTFLSALYEYSRELSYNQALELSEKYQQLAFFDSLTQLSNRRGALSFLKQELARVKRSKEPLSIILCDVDYFKKINDQYGHNAGDAVLIDLAKVFNNNIREQDCIARWGGEEFLFILPQTRANNANVFAEKIQKILQSHKVNFENENIKVGVSMGIAQFNGEQSIDEVINSADQYLYQAKGAGRNQIYPKF